MSAFIFLFQIDCYFEILNHAGVLDPAEQPNIVIGSNFNKTRTGTGDGYTQDRTVSLVAGRIESIGKESVDE